MKGQKLYIRAKRGDDDPALARFYERECASAKAPPATGALVGKFLGDIVAHLSFEYPDPSTMLIGHIYVASFLRKKRIGRAMVAEAAQLAATSGRGRLAVRKDARTDAFYRQIGFRDAGELLQRELDT